jgi:hypothetical protein
MHRSTMGGSSDNMNNSLSDLLAVMELSPKLKTCDTISIGTKDSLRKNNDIKLSKRGAKKNLLGGQGEGSMTENSLTELFGTNSFHDSKSMEYEATSLVNTDRTTNSKEGSTPKRSKRVGKKSEEKSDLERSLSEILSESDDECNQKFFPKDCATASTMDSMQREKPTKKTSKRGGKKNAILEKSDLERSLSGLDLEDDKDSKKISKDCMTVSTMDSIQRDKSTTKPLKRGGKKPGSHDKSDLERSLSGLSFDGDKEKIQHPIDCQTVSTMDSMNREKITSRPSKRGSKKQDVNAFQSPFEKTKPSLGSTLNKLGGPPRDFGRQADDNDTFCGQGDDTASPHSGSALSAPHQKSLKQSSLKQSKDLGGNDDSDSDDDDLFASFPGNNPFRLPTYL